MLVGITCDLRRQERRHVVSVGIGWGYSHFDRIEGRFDRPVCEDIVRGNGFGARNDERIVLVGKIVLLLQIELLGSDPVDRQRFVQLDAGLGVDERRGVAFDAFVGFLPDREVPVEELALRGGDTLQRVALDDADIRGELHVRGSVLVCLHFGCPVAGFQRREGVEASRFDTSQHHLFGCCAQDSPQVVAFQPLVVRPVPVRIARVGEIVDQLVFRVDRQRGTRFLPYGIEAGGGRRRAFDLRADGYRAVVEFEEKVEPPEGLCGVGVVFHGPAVLRAFEHGDGVLDGLFDPGAGAFVKIILLLFQARTQHQGEQPQKYYR